MSKNTIDDTADRRLAPVAGSETVRLAAPLEGRYCCFSAGAEVKIRMSGNAWTVERVPWTNSLTISNVLCGVPGHLIVLEESPNR